MYIKQVILYLLAFYSLNCLPSVDLKIDKLRLCNLISGHLNWDGTKKAKKKPKSNKIDTLNMTLGIILINASKIHYGADLYNPEASRELSEKDKTFASRSLRNALDEIKKNYTETDLNFICTNFYQNTKNNSISGSLKRSWSNRFSKRKKTHQSNCFDSMKDTIIKYFDNTRLGNDLHLISKPTATEL